nr:hypothetical protein JUJ52_00210 [Virgibacillus sp. AGTR]
MLVPHGYDLNTFEPIGHLLALDLPLIHTGFTLCDNCSIIMWEQALMKLNDYSKLYHIRS